VKAFRGKTASTYIHVGKSERVDSDEDTNSMHGAADSVLQISEVILLLPADRVPTPPGKSWKVLDFYL